ncbi:MAG: hypothetical protein VB110_09010 [Bacteroidales bacterium]|nr:hypothetical protein [Bacteroidales bacterium]
MAKGQMKTNFSIEWGKAQDVVHFSSPQQNVTLNNNSSGIIGLLLSQQLTDILYVETGLYPSKFTKLDVTKMSIDTTHLQLNKEEYHIPIRLRLQKSIMDERLSFFVSGGVILACPTKRKIHYGLHSNTPLLSYSDLPSLTTNKFLYTEKYALFELGTGVDVKLNSKLYLGLRYRYTFGWKNHINIEAVGVSPKAEITNYHLSSQGDYHSFTLSATYQIGTLWD